MLHTPPRTVSFASLAIGSLLILAGIFLSSASWLALFRDLSTVPPDLLPSLLLGATFFRISLVVTGILIIVLGRLPYRSTDGRSVPPTPPATPTQRWLLAGLLVVAFILRLYQLGAGMWHDEISTYVNYGHLSFGELVTTYDSQNQHLLFSLLARASLVLFGDGAWALRLPAAFFGVASIGALYLLGRDVAGVREALLSAALMTFSYHHIWFSQNARGYSGLLFWTILASWLLVRSLRDGSARTWLYYALTVALGIYTQLGMLFVVLGHFIIYGLALFKRRHASDPTRWYGLLLGFGVAGVLTVLLHALILPQFWADFTERTQGATFTTWQNPLWLVVEVVRAARIGFAGGSVALVALLIFGVGFVSWMRRRPIVVQLLVIPAVICAAVAIGTGHNLWPRLFFFTMGFGILVVVRGVMVLGTWIGQRLRLSEAAGLRLGVGMSIGMILMSGLTVLFVYGPKQDYQGALDYVEAHRQPGDIVVTTGMVAFTYDAYYHQAWPGVASLPTLDSLRAQAPRTWLLYAFRPHMEAMHPDILSAIERDFTVVERFNGTLGNGTIFVCRSDAPPPASSSATEPLPAEDSLTMPASP